jgi:ABC-type lipoprotein export system ATPase subunit
MASLESMWFESIEISNLAGSDKVLKYDLNTDVNIFFGENGSGKTSLLKILNAAATNTTNIAHVPFESAKLTINYHGNWRLVKEIVNTAHNKIIKEPPMGEITPLGTASVSPSMPIEDDLNWESSLYIKQDGKFIRYKPEEKVNYTLDHQYLPTSRLYLSLETERLWEKHQFTEQELEQNFAKIIRDRWKEYNYDLSSTEARTTAQGLANILSDLWSTPGKKITKTDIDLEKAYNRVNKFLNRYELEDVLKSFEDFSNRITDHDYLMNVIKDINDVEEIIEKAVVPKTKIQELITKLYGEKVRLAFGEKQITAKTENNKDIGLEALSSGQKQLLMIFLSILMANNRPILIDEPEISMHVDWQSALVGAMRQLTPSAQIIMATHSPEISASVGDDKLFRL